MANRYARPPKNDDDDEEISEQPLLIAQRHLVNMQPLGRAYITEDEKLAVYSMLARLKENRKTNAECADILSVSPRTITNYLADPYYGEVEQMLIHEAKRRGHLQISDVIDDAINKLNTLMTTARSEFVQYKSAEYLLKISGYENEVAERERDNQADVIKFLSDLEKSKKNRVQVNIQVNQSQPIETTVDAQVDATALQLSAPLILNSREIEDEDDELAQYLRPMLPGGKLPKVEEEEKD
jgi:hypothetical protein